ncbi:MAG: WD40 repeat domain-containing protein [Bacteroidota bacterium]
MLRKTLLSISLLALSVVLFGQANELNLEKLKYQVQKSGERDGRSKALGLAVLGYDFLPGSKEELNRLVYETYFTANNYEEYDEAYNELTFNKADWSPDGDQLAVAMGNGDIRIYNTNDFERFEKITINDLGVLDISWSLDGRFLAYGSADGETGYLNTSTWRKEGTWEAEDYIRGVAFSPDGKRIAAGGDQNILFVYNVETGDQERAFESHTDWIRAVSWSADGVLVAAASDDNTATVWSITQGNLVKTHRSHEDYCRDVAFSPSGQRLATVSDDLNVYVYDPATDNVPVKNWKGHENWVMAVDWSAKGRYLATADNEGTIIVHNNKNGEQSFYNAVEAETPWVDIDFSSDDERLAATSAYELAIYNIGESSPALRITPEGMSDGSGESSSSSDNQLEQLLGELLTGAVGLIPSGDENKMAIINENYQVNVVDMEAGSLLYTIDAHEDWIRNVSWSSDNRLLATASDDQMVGIWDAATGEMQQMLSGHTDWVRDVAFSPDDKVLTSAGDDGVLRFWDAETGDELGVTESIGSYLMTVKWSPDQAYLAAESSENTLYVWNAKNNEMLFVSSISVVQGSAKWVGDGELQVHSMEGQLMSWKEGGELETLGTGSGIEAVSKQGQKANAMGAYITFDNNKNTLLSGHVSTVTALNWSPDGNYLISQSSEGQVGLWDATNGQLLALMPLTDGLVKPYGGRLMVAVSIFLGLLVKLFCQRTQFVRCLLLPIIALLTRQKRYAATI